MISVQTKWRIIVLSTGIFQERTWLFKTDHLTISLTLSVKCLTCKHKNEFKLPDQSNSWVWQDIPVTLALLGSSRDKQISEAHWPGSPSKFLSFKFSWETLPQVTKVENNRIMIPKAILGLLPSLRTYLHTKIMHHYYHNRKHRLSLRCLDTLEHIIWTQK